MFVKIHYLRRSSQLSTFLFYLRHFDFHRERSSWFCVRPSVICVRLLVCVCFYRVCVCVSEITVGIKSSLGKFSLKCGRGAWAKRNILMNYEMDLTHGVEPLKTLATFFGPGSGL